MVVVASRAPHSTLFRQLSAKIIQIPNISNYFFVQVNSKRKILMVLYFDIQSDPFESGAKFYLLADLKDFFCNDRASVTPI